MIRHFLVAFATAALLMSATPARAQKGGGSHGGSHRSSAAKGRASSKPVHVKAYTKKDGTQVEAHDRKAPAPKGESGGPAPVVAAAPIRTYVDPATGRRTLTNAPLPTMPTLPARALPTATAAFRPVPTHKATTTGGYVTRAQRPQASTTATAPRTIQPHVATTTAIPRSASGRIARSAAARHAFARQTGYPNGRPGYVIDHIKPLACGGADAPSNMQWQTVAQGKAKDKIERIGCR
jgi:hypothetical protein